MWGKGRLDRLVGHGHRPSFPSTLGRRLEALLVRRFGPPGLRDHVWTHNARLSFDNACRACGLCEKLLDGPGLVPLLELRWGNLALFGCR